MESLVGLAILCGTPLLLVLVGALGGFIGGKMSSRVLRALDPEISEWSHEEIVKQSTKGFLWGFVVGGIPMGYGLASAAVTPFVDLSYQWALFVSIGFALMGAIGTTMAGSALFENK